MHSILLFVGIFIILGQVCRSYYSLKLVYLLKTDKEIAEYIREESALIPLRDINKSLKDLYKHEFKIPANISVFKLILFLGISYLYFVNVNGLMGVTLLFTSLFVFNCKLILLCRKNLMFYSNIKDSLTTERTEE